MPVCAQTSLITDEMGWDARTPGVHSHFILCIKKYIENNKETISSLNYRTDFHLTFSFRCLLKSLSMPHSLGRGARGLYLYPTFIAI